MQGVEALQARLKVFELEKKRDMTVLRCLLRWPQLRLPGRATLDILATRRAVWGCGAFSFSAMFFDVSGARSHIHISREECSAQSVIRCSCRLRQEKKRDMIADRKERKEMMRDA